MNGTTSREIKFRIWNGSNMEHDIIVGNIYENPELLKDTTK